MMLLLLFAGCHWLL
jgi:hypothetical protein